MFHVVNYDAVIYGAIVLVVIYDAVVLVVIYDAVPSPGVTGGLRRRRQ